MHVLLDGKGRNERGVRGYQMCNDDVALRKRKRMMMQRINEANKKNETEVRMVQTVFWYVGVVLTIDCEPVRYITSNGETEQKSRLSISFH